MRHFDDDVRRSAVAILDGLSIDVQVLRAGIYAGHHRVRGCEAVALHRLIGDYAEALDGYADTLAELVEQLGGQSSGSVEELAASTRLRPWPSGVVEGCVLGALVVNRSSAWLALAEQAIKDLLALGMQAAANDVMTIQSAVLKWSWKVDAGLPTSEQAQEDVYEQLAEDFPPEAIAWVRSDPMGKAAPAPEAGRASRFVTDGSEIQRGADGVLRV
jgi:DNA-binding ferritin-like protein